MPTKLHLFFQMHMIENLKHLNHFSTPSNHPSMPSSNQRMPKQSHPAVVKGQRASPSSVGKGFWWFLVKF